MSTPKQTFEQALEIIQDKSYLDEDTGCFIWMGCTTGSLGYGVIRCEGKPHLIHRLIYQRLKCSIHVDAVRHSCDHPRCWNPEHLIGGSQKDNMIDARLKSRNSHGEQHYYSVLTADVVQEIRRLPINDTELAKKYNVTKTAIRHARIGRTWKHL